LGLGGDELAPVGIDLAATSPALLVVGAAGTGRTTVLAAVAHSVIASGGDVVVVGDDECSLWAGVRDRLVRRADPHDREAVAAALVPDGDQLLVVLVDDVEAIAGTAAEPLLLPLTRGNAPSRSVALVAAGSSTHLASAYSGLAAELRRGRTVLALQPSEVEEQLLGRRLPRVDDPRPGRGVLLTGTTSVAVQVAH
jgi:S-DNA-T family DNA segregation ATPase FtsK/SpoIIIE